MPSGPSVTACTAAVFVTIVKTTSLCSATSRGVSRPARAGFEQRLRLLRRPVPDRDRVAGVEQAARDRAAHHAEADVAELSHRATLPSSTSALDADEVGAHLRSRAASASPRGDRSADRAMLDRRSSRGCRGSTKIDISARRMTSRTACMRVEDDAGCASPRRSRDGSGGRRRCSGRRVVSSLRARRAISVDRGVHLREVRVTVPLRRERRRLALENPAQLVDVEHRCLVEAEQQLERAVQRVRVVRHDEGSPLPRSRSRPATRASGAPRGPTSGRRGTPAVSSRSGGQRVARLEAARADLPQQLLRDQLVDLPALDRLVAHAASV